MPEYEVRITRVYNITAKGADEAYEKAKDIEYHSAPAYAGTKAPDVPEWLSELQDSYLSFASA